MSVKESVVFDFETHSGKSRSLSLPDPAAGVSATDLGRAAAKILLANVFDESVGSGRPVKAKRATHVVVESTPWF